MKFLLNDGVMEFGKRLVGYEEMKDMFWFWNILCLLKFDKYFFVIKGVLFLREYIGYVLGLKIGFYRGMNICFFCWFKINLIGFNSMVSYFVKYVNYY